MSRGEERSPLISTIKPHIRRLEERCFNVCIFLYVYILKKLYFLWSGIRNKVVVEQIVVQNLKKDNRDMFI